MAIFPVLWRSLRGCLNRVSLQSLYIPVSSRDQDLIVADLWENGTLGTLEESDGLRAFFEDDMDLASFVDRYPDARIQAIDESAAFDRRFTREDPWDPILVGERFYIAPSWVEQPTPLGRLRLAIDSTSAFGSGRHESTQLVIEALEKELRTGSTVIDVGSGSGILLAAAGLLGADRLFGCDIHSDSLGAARNLVRCPMFQGSVDAVGNSCADLVLVNISARIIDELAFELKRITRPGGLLLLAGFIRNEPPLRFTPEKILERDDWQCWVCRPEAISGVGACHKPLQPFEQQWW